MIFHSIDNNSQCKTVYLEDKLISNPDYKQLTGTWDYKTDHDNDDIQYAKLYLSGKSIEAGCPLHLQAEWNKVKNKHNAFIKSFITSGVKATDYCFYDLVPESFLHEYFGHKIKIIEYILKTHNKPPQYDYLLDLRKLLCSIEENKLCLDMSPLTPLLHQYKTRKFKERLNTLPPIISYKLFGTVTGRLTTQKNSFPILTLDKDYRCILKPNNDYFIEFDFNGAELRCLLALNGKDQPEGDIHKWHEKIMSKIYNGEMDRGEIKRKMFAWLYGGLDASLGMPQIESYYNKRQALKKYWDGLKIVNPFGREIECDEFRALNFLIQSTTSDLFLRRAIEVNNLLKGKKSKITALIHDSILLDFSKEDKNILPDLLSTFEKTELGNFRVNKKIGLNFGNMKEF